MKNYTFPVGALMTHTSAEACLQPLAQKAWIAWGDLHGTCVEPCRRNYYNLPARGPTEAYAEPTETRSEYYWELYAVDAPYPSDMPNQDDMAQALLITHDPEQAAEKADEIAATRRGKATAKESACKARAQDLISRVKSILPAHIMTGSRMADEMVALGGEAAELVQLTRPLTTGYSLDDVRAALRA